jgi:hypothetical protein
MPPSGRDLRRGAIHASSTAATMAYATLPFGLSRGSETSHRPSARRCRGRAHVSQIPTKPASRLMMDPSETRCSPRRQRKLIAGAYSGCSSDAIAACNLVPIVPWVLHERHGGGRGRRTGYGPSLPGFVQHSVGAVSRRPERAHPPPALIREGRCTRVDPASTTRSTSGDAAGSKSWPPGTRGSPLSGTIDRSSGKQLQRCGWNRFRRSRPWKARKLERHPASCAGIDENSLPRSPMSDPEGSVSRADLALRDEDDDPFSRASWSGFPGGAA